MPLALMISIAALVGVILLAVIFYVWTRYYEARYDRTYMTQDDRGFRRALEGKTVLWDYEETVVRGPTAPHIEFVALDPATGELVQADIATEARRVFDNLKAVCEAAGGSMDDVARVGIYLTDLSDFAAVNAVMADYFEAPYPARSTIQVSGLPKGARVEVDAVMVTG